MNYCHGFVMPGYFQVICGSVVSKNCQWLVSTKTPGGWRGHRVKANTTHMGHSPLKNKAPYQEMNSKKKKKLETVNNICVSPIKQH